MREPKDLNKNRRPESTGSRVTSCIVDSLENKIGSLLEEYLYIWSLIERKKVS